MFAFNGNQQSNRREKNGMRNIASARVLHAALLSVPSVIVREQLSISVLNHGGKNKNSRIILQASVWIQFCLEMGRTQTMESRPP